LGDVAALSGGGPQQNADAVVMQVKCLLHTTIAHLNRIKQKNCTTTSSRKIKKSNN